MRLQGSIDTWRESVRNVIVENGIPSIAVAVARDGEVVWEEGFGWANRADRVQATAHTMYSLASISKPITATGLMILVERGLIDLDAPVNAYLGQAKLQARVGNADEATVRRVANHTSGLPVHCQFFYEDEPYRRPPMDETIRRYGTLVTAPGERYQYSNLGYGVLDDIIARVSGQSYVDFMRTEVFIPLGLTHTSVHIDPGLAAYEAVRYASDGTAIPFYDFDHPGASAVFSSAHDLVRFGMFHLKNHLPDQKRILRDETIDGMHKPTSEPDGNVGYGIGWRSDVSEGGLRTLSHNGGMGGVSTTLTLVPDENTAVAVLCNASSGAPHEIKDTILAAVFPGKAEKPETREESEQNQPVAFGPELVGEWKGEVHTYRDAIPLVLEVKPSGDVHARLGDALWTLVNDVRYEDGYLGGVMAGDIHTDDANRRPYHLHLEVKHRGNVLNGSLSARSKPSKRMGNCLTHWVALGKG